MRRGAGARPGPRLGRTAPSGAPGGAGSGPRAGARGGGAQPPPQRAAADLRAAAPHGSQAPRPPAQPGPAGSPVSIRDPTLTSPQPPSQLAAAAAQISLLRARVRARALVPRDVRLRSRETWAGLARSSVLRAAGAGGSESAPGFAHAPGLSLRGPKPGAGARARWVPRLHAGPASARRLPSTAHGASRAQLSSCLAASRKLATTGPP